MVEGCEFNCPSSALEATGFLQLVCGVVAPIVFQSIYAMTAESHASSVFFVVSAASALGLVLTYGIRVAPPETAKEGGEEQPLLGGVN